MDEQWTTPFGRRIFHILYTCSGPDTFCRIDHCMHFTLAGHDIILVLNWFQLAGTLGREGSLIMREQPVLTTSWKRLIGNTLLLEYSATFCPTLSDQRNNEQVRICLLACFSFPRRWCHLLCDIRKEGWPILHQLQFHFFNSQHGDSIILAMLIDINIKLRN